MSIFNLLPTGLCFLLCTTESKTISPKIGQHLLNVDHFIYRPSTAAGLKCRSQPKGNESRGGVFQDFPEITSELLIEWSTSFDSRTWIVSEFPRDHIRAELLIGRSSFDSQLAAFGFFFELTRDYLEKLHPYKFCFPTDSKSSKIAPPYIKAVARQGSDVTLECNTNSIYLSPIDSWIKWTKEGKNIEDNAKTRKQYRLPDGRNGFSLNIKNVSTQDAGEYECVVTIFSGKVQLEMKATRELQIFQKGMWWWQPFTWQLITPHYWNKRWLLWEYKMSHTTTFDHPWVSKRWVLNRNFLSCIHFKPE